MFKIHSILESILYFVNTVNGLDFRFDRDDRVLGDYFKCVDNLRITTVHRSSTVELIRSVVDRVVVVEGSVLDDSIVVIVARVAY